VFVHTVYFWLNEGTPDEVRRQLTNDCEDLLSEIPAVQHIWSGNAANTPRDVVDNSYDVGLCVVLHNKQGHDEYQVHPKHQEFINRYKQYWKRVQIYDFHRGG
jgi:hypothetical protein